ncbi:MFS transporter [Actinomycetospora straminea]|uniref:MFS transporter n=1 Tax=Actinomycetospora straminea TaxID=663607 RepID=A0ABP9EBQ6_9PSEU|nr:MFS transporter [Actinomycetospora straminea]MDD7932240.1 MFS transporter [Actinomycetospora straminea]
MATVPPRSDAGGPTPAPTPAHARRVARATFVGTAIEWYDFNIYGAAAALIFAPQFFPNFSPAAGLLAAFGTFAVGFIARPVGGIVFGHFGDRFGRKHTLVASLLLMGIGTFLIALLPTYSAIGIAAPILLVTLRFVQGLGVGGEWGGAVLMAMEHAPKQKKGWFSSFPQMGLPAGNLAALAVFLIVSTSMERSAFLAWGWRIPFLLSAALVLVALVIRLRLSESPEFAGRRTARSTKLPVLETLRTHPGAVLLGMGITLAPSSFGYLNSVYLLSYGTTTVGIAQQTMLLSIMGGCVLYLAVTILTGFVSDRVGPARIFVGASALGVAIPFAVFALIDTGATPAVVAGLCLLGLVLGMLAAVQAVIVSGAFPTAIRYTGASMAYQFGAVFGGGLLPLVAAAILGATGSSMAVAAYIGVLSAISGIAVWRLAAGTRHDLDDAGAAEPAPVAGGAVRS